MAKHMTATAAAGDSATSKTTTIVDTTEPPAPTKLLTARQAGEQLGVSSETLERWRGAGTGPAFVKLSGKYIRYQPGDLEEFVKARRCQSTARA